VRPGDDGDQAAACEQRGERVEPARFWVACLFDPMGGQRECSGDERQVDPEDHVPACVVDEEAAEQGQMARPSPLREPAWEPYPEPTS
jgi:hypothetical protein